MRLSEVLFLLAAPLIVIFSALAFVPRRNGAKWVLSLLVLSLGFLFDINFVSHEWYRGYGRGFQISLTDLIAWGIGLRLLFTHRLSRKFDFLALLLGLQFLIGLTSTIGAFHPLYATFELWMIFKCLVFYVVAKRALEHVESLHSLVGSLGILALLLVVQAFKEKYLHGITRVSAGLAHSNSYAMFAILLFSIFTSLVFHRAGKARWLWLLAPFVALSILFTLSRAAWALTLFSGIALFAWSFIRRPSWRLAGVAAVILVLGSLVFVKAADTIRERIESAPEESLDDRVLMNVAALKMANDRFLGVGPNGFAFAVNPPFSYGSHIPGGAEEEGGVAHNIYLLEAAEGGWISALILVVIAVVSVGRCLMPVPGAPMFYRALLSGLGVGFLAFHVQGLLEWVAKQPEPRMLFLFLAAFAFELRRRARSFHAGTVEYQP